MVVSQNVRGRPAPLGQIQNHFCIKKKTFKAAKNTQKDVFPVVNVVSNDDGFAAVKNKTGLEAQEKMDGSTLLWLLLSS